MNKNEKLIIEYCSKTPEFRLCDAEESLGQTKIEGHNIANFLEYCPLTFHDPTRKHKDRFISRHHFFKGFKFRMVLSDFEIANSILIPGHRFVPFYFSDIYASSFSLVCAKSNGSIPIKKRALNLKDLYDYYFAFDSETIKSSIIDDDKDNAKVIGKNPDGLVNINVFDLKILLSKTSKFNSLIVEVIDWTKGKFNAELSYEESPSEHEEAYIFAEELQSSLFKTFDYFGPYLNVPEQLAWAIFISDKKNLSKPVISLEEALGLSEQIDFKYYEENTILWYKNDDASSWEKHSSIKKNTPFSISSGNISSLDSIFDELKIPITTKEISLFLNAFAQNDKSNLSLIALCLPKNFVFKDKAQEIALINKLEEISESFIPVNLPERTGQRSEFIYKYIEKLRTLINSYNFDILTSKYSEEEIYPAYRDIRDQINSLSSILSYYIHNPDTLSLTKDFHELAGYIESHFRSIDDILKRPKN